MTTTLADKLAQWAEGYAPDRADLELAQRSLQDTLAVALAAREHPIRGSLDSLPDAARWSVLAHVLDFDDLHVESTTHISAVVVPAVLTAGGDARAYLAGAGVMARLGKLLGWSHYSAGWHATCTAGAPAAAVAAGVSWGLSARQLAQAMALAVPAAGGVHAAFGTQAKALQVGSARRPPSGSELHDKLAACWTEAPRLLADATWDSARQLLRTAAARSEDALASHDQ